MINRIIILIFVNCFLFGRIQADPAEDFSVDKFSGSWYGIGVISRSIDYMMTYSCYKINITKQNDHDNSFHEDVMVKMNGVQKIAHGFGAVDKSIIRVYFPNIKNAEETVYSVEVYNEGQEIILRNNNQTDPIGGLFSRTTIVSQTTKSEFEEMSPQGQTNIFYMDNNNC